MWLRARGSVSSARLWFPGRHLLAGRSGKGEARMEEVTDEPLYRDRVCGIDIGKAQMVATIRVPSDKDPARRAQETRSFGTTKRGVLALAGWLRCWQVPAAVMEATGDYWKGPFYRLEAEGFECVLADARQVKNLPGRPERDPADSRWLAACFERGAVTYRTAFPNILIGNQNADSARLRGWLHPDAACAQMDQLCAFVLGVRHG